MVIGTDYRVILSNRPRGQEQRFCYQLSHHRETPCDGSEHPCPLDAVLQEKAQAAVIHQHFNAQGEARHVELLASPLRDENGAITAIIESAHDITERLNAETALREINEPGIARAGAGCEKFETERVDAQARRRRWK
jgi:hypothetical protein